jgi:hypothetical protein
MLGSLIRTDQINIGECEMATITKLNVQTKVVAQPKAKSKSWIKRMARQKYAAYGVGTISLVLTGLSLSHLASGVQLLTQADQVQSYAMATGIDLGFIGLELAQIFSVSESLKKAVGKFAGPAVKATLAMSAVMNAYAFAVHSPNSIFAGAAAALGISIPALIYVLTRVSVAMWIDCEK